ncbi:MAG: MBL fold metallo-hydrolase [Candidatus Eremiobacteraeota bacterium]|nr:MBL fold metallo-hydrolase [Candidatus Eremiobacteraeota bacterium]
MFFRQLYDEGLAHASYVVGSETAGEALVVDPRRDIDVYTDLAAAHDLRIVGVAETHIHADYLSGGRELAAATGAMLYVSGHGDEQMGYVNVQNDVRLNLVLDGDDICFGDLRVRVRHTPGHTPEHICFEVFDGADKIEPMLLLSGDFIFVGDLGRPDLLEEALGVSGAARSSAHAMYASLAKALATLPDYTQIWPAHGAGSACGKALSAIPSTTLGYERRFSWWSAFARKGDEDGFVNALLKGQPDAPSYFARMKHLNRGFTAILGHVVAPSELDASTLKASLDAGAMLVDTRPREAFCARHVTGAVSIPDKPSFATRSAWFGSPEREIVLLAKPARVDALVRALVRVGLDNVKGYVDSDKPQSDHTSSLPSISVEEAERRWSADHALILDVRQHGEFAHGHIPHAHHLSAGKLMDKLEKIPKDRELLIVCGGGDRSVSAASVLCAHGYERVSNVADGFEGWQRKGLPVNSQVVAN